jgi:hypothetical protein
MPEGLTRLERFPDEFSALNARQFLVDNGITAEVFKGGFIAYMEQFDLFVENDKMEQARGLLKEFEASLTQAAEEQAEQEPAEGENEHPEADCEGKGE